MAEAEPVKKKKKEKKKPPFRDPQGEPIMVVSGPTCGHRVMKFRKNGKVVG